MGEICFFLSAHLYFLNCLMNMYCFCKETQFGELNSFFNVFFLSYCVCEQEVTELGNCIFLRAG